MRPREKVKLCQKESEEWEETMVAQSVLLLNSCEDFGSPDAMLFLARQDTTIVTEKNSYTFVCPAGRRRRKKDGFTFQNGAAAGLSQEVERDKGLEWRSGIHRRMEEHNGKMPDSERAVSYNYSFFRIGRQLIT